LLVVLLLLGLAGGVAAEELNGGLREWLGNVSRGLEKANAALVAGDLEKARAEVLKAYLDSYEVIEGWYGPGGAYAIEPLARRISEAEAGFHVVLRSNSATEVKSTIAQLAQQMTTIGELASAARVTLYPSARAAEAPPAANKFENARTTEGAQLLAGFKASENALHAGKTHDALRAVEQLYLEHFEPLESRLPQDMVGRVERIIHLQLRPALRAPGNETRANTALAALGAELGAVDEFLVRGGSFWFGAVNSFVIIVREGLEAVLLIAALLAYLTASGASRITRRRIWAGAGAGVVATMVTWVIASTLIPVGGASRELVEGITAIAAVCVLLYVSHWLFQKTYIHDWKTYLRDHLGQAVTHGSTLAMVGLAFAAVYREGFETVLFYQALLFDVGGRSVWAGFLPGLALISFVGWIVIQAGVKLPLKRVFAVTNTILLYLSFVFLGKGIFNLQESGIFAAHPISWLPAHPALQQIFGFYPLLETVLAQLGLALLLVGVLLVYKVKVIPQRRREEAAPRAVAA
jgi:high-affinity iron transporter